MPEHKRDEDEVETFDLTVRCPGVAYDVGQKGFARVLVVQRLADSVAEYDDRRADGEKGQLEYFKNALVGATEDDAVYQCVYLPDNPAKRGGLNDPNARYPVPESRLVPMRHDMADPVDNSSSLGPREAVQRDTLEALFDVALAFADAPSADTLEVMARHTSLDRDAIREAREAAEADSYENVPNDMTLDSYEGLEVDDRLSTDETDNVAVDDSGMEAELTDAEAVEELGGGAATDVQDTSDSADGESESDREDPPEPPEDGGPDSVAELDDGELGDFNPENDIQ